MFRLSDLSLVGSKAELAEIPDGKVLINTVNAHSYNVAQKDEAFSTALRTVHGEGFMVNGSSSECVKYLIPDGASIVKACKWLKAKSQPKERIAGWDLFSFEMGKLEGRCKREDGRRLRVMFMGSSEKVLELIRERAAKDYPHVEVVSYSPPYKAEFTEEENREIIRAINEAKPDLLWIGMTAPKQEKWTWKHWAELDINCHVGTIGAVFDFYAGTVKRAPLWWQEHGLEWLYRLLKEPRRMWRRYLIGNLIFIWNVSKERWCL